MRYRQRDVRGGQSPERGQRPYCRPVMVVFTGSHVKVSEISATSVFEAATRPDLLGRWITGNFANVRVEGAAPLSQGSRFLADESLADGPDEKDHLSAFWPLSSLR